jgi:hypothetical protein
MQDNIVIA